MSEGLQIRIGAEVAQAEQGIKRVSKALAEVPKNAAPVSAAITRVNASLNSVKPGSAQATNALMNFGRIAQDAPFGLIGIVNNINPALESLQRLGESTKGAGGSLKALGSALTGPAGLGLAVSVGSSLLLAFGGELLEWVTKASKAEEQQIALNRAISDSAASTQGEIAQIRSLVSIAGDENESRKVRVQALKELQKEYPAYFENIKFDGKLNENLAIAIDRATQSILLNAKAKAIQKQIDESALKVSEAQNQNVLKNLTFLDKLKAGFQIGAGAAGIAQTVGQAAQRTNEIVSEETKFQERLAKQLEETNKQLGAQGSLFTGKVKPEKISKISADVDRIELKPATVGIAGGRWSKGFDGMAEVADKSIQSINATLGRPLVAPTLNLKPVTKSFDQMDLAVQNGIDRMNEAINDQLVSLGIQAAESLGTAIGTALTGGDLQGVFSGFISFFADGLISLGKTAVGIGVTLTGLKAAIESLGGPGAIAVGIAAIAAGAAIKAALPKFAKGGLVTGPTVGMIGEAGPEVIFPLNKINDFVKGIVPQSQAAYIPNVTLKGQDMVIAFSRAQGRWGSSNRL